MYNAKNEISFTSGFISFQNEAVTKMFIYYDACVNTSQIKSVGSKPLRLVVAKYGSWNVTDPHWNESGWNLIKHLAEIHRDLGVMPLFKVVAEPDYKDSSRNIITVVFICFISNLS